MKMKNLFKEIKRLLNNTKFGVQEGPINAYLEPLMFKGTSIKDIDLDFLNKLHPDFNNIDIFNNTGVKLRYTANKDKNIVSFRYDILLDDAVSMLSEFVDAFKLSLNGNEHTMELSLSLKHGRFNYGTRFLFADGSVEIKVDMDAFTNMVHKYIEESNLITLNHIYIEFFNKELCEINKAELIADERNKRFERENEYYNKIENISKHF